MGMGGQPGMVKQKMYRERKALAGSGREERLWPQIFKGQENLRREAIVSRVIWYG